MLDVEYLEVLTRQLATFLNIGERFNAARAQGVATADAVMEALKETETWKSAQEHKARWQRTLQRFSDPLGLGARDRLGSRLGTLSSGVSTRRCSRG